MNWNIIIPIVVLITDILLGWFCYTLGCETAKPIEDINNRILERRKELQDDVDKLKDEVYSLEQKQSKINNEISLSEHNLAVVEQKRLLIKKSNEESQKFIAQSEQLAKEKAEAIYEKRYDELAHEYQIYKRDLQTIIDRNKDKIQKQEQELQSLKDTKIAAIAAAQKEKEIQDNKEDYCLILPIEYSNDVKILRGVAKQIAKPRSILMAIWQAYYAPLAKKKFPQILGKTDVCGIYKITNQETGECYIGQAVDIRRRWMDHCKAGLGIDTPQGNQLYAAMQEYGLDVFSFELLLECESKELNEKEKYFIELYNSNAIGYNMNKGVN